MNIQEFFKNGLDRTIPELAVPPQGRQINLGPGDKKIITYSVPAGVSTLDFKRQTIGVGGGKQSEYPSWRYPRDPLTATRVSVGGVRGLFDPESVAAIHCYQFIEHLLGSTAVILLRECEEILMPGGVMYIAAPYYRSAMAYQALDHLSYWSEETWQWLFGNEYYSDHEGKGWRFRVHACFIMGVVERNMNLFTQLVKE